MSVQTVKLSFSTCVRCGGAAGAEVVTGDSVKLWLDQEHTPAFPEWIPGVVVIVEEPSVLSTELHDYTVEYNTDALEGAASSLRACDVLSLTCVSCCTILQEQIDALRADDRPQVTLSYKWDASGEIALLATAYSNWPEATIVGYTWIDPDGAEIESTTIPTLTVPDSGTTSFLGGVYGVTVTDSLGHTAQAFVNVDPTNTKIRTVLATVLTGNSSVDVSVNALETVLSVIQLAAGSGVMLESAAITVPGTAVLQFTGTVGSNLGLAVTIGRLKYTP